MQATLRFETRRPRTSGLAPMLIVVACTLAGCSSGTSDTPPLGQVSGAITMGGKPVSDAQVLFVPASGSPSVGKTDAEGRYTLAYSQDVTGAEIGRHTVQITKFGEPGSPNDTTNLLPEKYNQNSPLTAEVKEGENSFDFELNSGP